MLENKLVTINNDYRIGFLVDYLFSSKMYQMNNTIHFLCYIITKSVIFIGSYYQFSNG